MVRDIITDVEALLDGSETIDLKREGELARTITADLKDTIEANDLNCLSAPQIGYPYRILCIKYEAKGKKGTPVTSTYINPVISEATGMVLDRETDPCFPDREFIYPRNNEVFVVYQNPMKKSMSQKFTGRAASIMQQMVDHLDGIVIEETGLEIDEDFDAATEEEKNELLDKYMESLDLYRKELEKDVEEDADLKQTRDAVDFIQSVREGETKLSGRIGITENQDVIDIEDE